MTGPLGVVGLMSAADNATNMTVPALYMPAGGDPNITTSADIQVRLLGFCLSDICLDRYLRSWGYHLPAAGGDPNMTTLADIQMSVL